MSSIWFDPKRGHAHFREDGLDEASLLESMRTPVWHAFVHPSDPLLPPSPRPGRGIALLMIVKRHRGALDDDLVELLITPADGGMKIFHAEHLTDRWSGYWRRYR